MHFCFQNANGTLYYNEQIYGFLFTFAIAILNFAIVILNEVKDLHHII